MEIDYSILPAHMQEGMRNYIEHGVRPGSFLRAVLENDLCAAALKADEINQASLHRYARFLRNEAPATCHGSREKVSSWMRSRHG